MRWSADLQRQSLIHRLLRGLYRSSRRQPVGVLQWDAQYAGDYGDRLGSINEVTHHMAIVGYLGYGANEPRVLDVGCGHGRLLQLLANFNFAEYVGVDWSGQAVERGAVTFHPAHAP